MTITPTIVWSVISALSGGLVMTVVAHFVAGRDVAYMKGQLSALMNIHERVGKVENKNAVLEESHKGLRNDVNRLGAKMRSSSQPTQINGA